MDGTLLDRPFPWRTATLVVGALAVVELVALVALGAAQLAPVVRRAAPQREVAKTRALAHLRRASPPPSHALRPRPSVPVLVLNGNGIRGAAAHAAVRLNVLGYRVGGTANASRHDYARSMVMYVPGWVREARRLARDTGVRLVSPIDGVTPSSLRGAKVVLLLGS